MTQKAQATKENYKLDFIKIFKPYTSKDTVKKISPVWWQRSVIPALGRLRLKKYKIKTNLKIQSKSLS
jgi:hypothetical protein